MAPFIPFILVGMIFSYLFGFADKLIPVGSSVPYIFSPLFLGLIAAIWPLIKESSELRELESITHTERSRLSDMVRSAQVSLAWSIVFLFIFCFSSGGITYFSTIGVISLRWALRWIGLCVGISFCILAYVLFMKIKVSNFKAEVVSRMQEMKQQQKLLKRTAIKKTSNDNSDGKPSL
ncbi:hypothetical protein RI534_08360 [Aeromonas allosaccharophila]|uniref:hypothetical protein n=1 Tax=Aeromonas allosaccharophila TaxID=656 RepID=UPI003443F269